MEDVAAKLLAYDAWIVELTARQKELAGQRRFYLRLFVAIPFVSGLAFFVNLWLGAAALFTGVLMCAFGFYVVMGRESEYVRELALTRRAAEELRERVTAS